VITATKSHHNKIERNVKTMSEADRQYTKIG